MYYNITTQCKKWTIKVLGFVDDKWYYSNLVNQIINESITEAMSKSTNMWNELLTFIGGKLELTKCTYYIIEQDFDSTEHSHITSYNYSISFQSTKGKGSSTQLQSRQSLKYLGVISQPNEI